MQDMDPKIAKSFGLPESTKGVIVSRLAEGGPGDRAGLLQGDIIQKVDGQAVTKGTEIQDLVRKHKPGDTINFLVLRNNAVSAVSVKVTDIPSEDDAH